MAPPDDHLDKVDDITANKSQIEDFVGYNLKRAYMLVQADFRDALGNDGLAPRVFSALSLVCHFPNITQSELARRLGIERSGLVAIVDELEENGFLGRAAVPGDRRVQALVPTQSGFDAYATALAKVREHERRFFAHFSDEERATMMRLLQKIRRQEEQA